MPTAIDRCLCLGPRGLGTGSVIRHRADRQEKIYASCFGKDQKTKQERDVVRKEEGGLLKGDGRRTRRERKGGQERNRERGGEKEESVGNVTPLPVSREAAPG